MKGNWLDEIPENLRESARGAVSAAFGAAEVSAIAPVLGGASGAQAYRIESRGRAYLLRIETRRTLRNPHQYTCMRIASGAGLAPAVRYADDAAGVAIIDFIAQRPLADLPGGAVGLARALGELAAKLQATEAFPVLTDFRAFVGRGLSVLHSKSAAGLLDPHVEAFERIQQAYPWDAAGHVSSHNDPNPHNILYDGERLWLIDWESAFRNDPMTDVAILAENHAPTPEMEEALLRAWLGHEPGREVRARLYLMRMLTRLYYAGLLFAIFGRQDGGLTDLASPTPDEFRTMVASGQLKAGDPESMLVLAKMMLAGFQARARGRAFEEALEASGGR